MSWVCFTWPPLKCNEQESPYPIGLIFKKGIASVVRLMNRVSVAGEGRGGAAPKAPTPLADTVTPEVVGCIR